MLVSQRFTEPFRDPITYGRSIAKLANLLGDGILVQRYSDLKSGPSLHSRADRAGDRSSPRCLSATPGDLSAVLPYRHLTDIIEFIEALDALAPGIAGPSTLYLRRRSEVLLVATWRSAADMQTQGRGPLRHRRRCGHHARPRAGWRERRARSARIDCSAAGQLDGDDTLELAGVACSQPMTRRTASAIASSGSSPSTNELSEVADEQRHERPHPRLAGRVGVRHLEGLVELGGLLGEVVVARFARSRTGTPRGRIGLWAAAERTVRSTRSVEPDVRGGGRRRRR